MDYDGQRLLDVINDPNALESFLGSVGGGGGGSGGSGGDVNAGDSFTGGIGLQSAEPCSFSPAVIPPSPAASSPGLGQANVPASPQQLHQQQPQRRDSLSSTPVASPINYPPGPGPGSVQLPAGTITIPALATAVGQVQQLVSGGQVLQIVSSPAGANATVRHPVANVRVKQQPQLRPKPANTASPGPVQSPVMSPRTSSPVIVQPPQPQQQIQQQAPQQQQQLQQQQQHPQHIQHQQQSQQAQVAPAAAQMVQLGAGGPTGTLVFSSGAPTNPVFPALAPTGGQFFLQQQSNGSFQLVVRPQAPPPPQMIASSPPRQPAVVQPAVHIARPPAVQQMAPMVRLVTLPGLGTVQLQQIQTPNGPAFLAVQQPQTIAAQPIAQPITQTVTQGNLATSTAFVRAPFVQQAVQQPQQHQQQMLQQQQQQHQQQLQQQQHQQQVASPNEVNENGGQTFATPPAKKPPAKKKSTSKTKKKPEVTEEKKPAVNLEELLKQTGIVGDDDFSMFMDDDQSAADPVPAPNATTTPGVAPVQLQPDPPAVEAKENNVIDGALISEANILQTLQQHGLALASDDLVTLRNFIKPAETVVVNTDSDNGTVKPKPTVSLTLSNGQVIQLTDPLQQQQPAPLIVEASAAPVTQTTTNAVNHGFQNEFLEDLARSQIVPEAKKAKKQTTPVNNNNGAKKKPPAPKKKPAEASSGTAGTITTTTATASSGGGTRVQTIKLSPQNQQNLRNIQAQIQYLNSKKDPTPQETSLLQKLIEHHQNILATGKPVPTIPGQHAQGISAEGNVESPATATTVAPSSGRSQNKVVPANIQQNTHLANLLRQPVADKNPRVTATQQPAQRPTQPAQRAPAPSSSGSMTVTPVASPRFVVPVATPNGTPSSIQTPVGTLLLTVVDTPATIATPASDGAATPASSTSAGVTIAESPDTIPAPSTSTSSTTTARGVKRPAPAPKPTISKNTLFEHQLKTDQNGALTPDCKTPFTSKTNACKRLIRYHVFHELDPSPAELEKEEDELEDRAQQLLSKFQQMVNKYHHLLVVESTKEAPASEYVMVERMFVSEEKQLLERLKEEARVAKELNLTPVWPVKSEPTTTTAGDGAVNGRRDSPCDEVKSTPKMGLLKFTRKDGEGYRSEIQEYKEVKCEDVVRNGLTNHCVGQDRMVGNSIGCDDGEAKPYDEWEAIQRELALYPDNRDKDEMDFDGDGAMYDDDIKAQMQNAIDDLLKLNGCDEGPPAVADPAYSALTNGDQYGGDVHVDLALNEAVNSIL